MDLNQLIKLPIPEVREIVWEAFVPSYESALLAAGFRRTPNRTLRYVPDDQRDIYLENYLEVKLSKTIDTLQRIESDDLLPVVLVLLQTFRIWGIILPLISGPMAADTLQTITGEHNAELVLHPVSGTTPFDPNWIVHQTKQLVDTYWSDIPLLLKYKVYTRDFRAEPPRHMMMEFTPFPGPSSSRSSVVTQYFSDMQRVRNGQLNDMNEMQCRDLVRDIDIALDRQGCLDADAVSEQCKRIGEVYRVATEECYSPYTRAGQRWMRRIGRIMPGLPRTTLTSCYARGIPRVAPY